MQVINGLHRIKKKFKRPIIALGTFDGIHIGHQKVIKQAVKRANLRGGTSIVLTFDLHPLRVISPDSGPPLLTSLRHKIKLLDELGVRKCVLIKFDRDFFTLRPQDFVEKILVKGVGVNEIFLGNNYHFGRDRKGDIKLMKVLADRYSFRLHKVSLVKIDGRIVSSSRIRSLLQQGKLKTASELLGRPFSILGQVTGGSKRGRLIGYPTANLKPYHEVIPPSGVYAVRLKLGQKLYGAIVNVGTRPTFAFISKENLEPVIEVHIFDFGSCLYGHEIEIIFVKKIRNERRFPGKEKLVKQIGRDEVRARRILDSPLQCS